MNNLIEIENKVLNILLPLQKKNILVAVSGGIDSMVLLTVLSTLRQHLECRLSVLTINHGIRSDEETSADVKLVKSYCNKLGDICCYEKKFLPGEVDELAVSRNRGIEEAARFLRYKAFDEIVEKINADCVCLGHNQNDRLETILQRFLQGAGGSSAVGMNQKRGVYLRPLFDVSRESIKEYAELKSVPYRNDSTNNDTSYVRNRIRINLIPILDTNFPGWQSAILSGAEKHRLDTKVLDDMAQTFVWLNENNSLSADRKSFIILPEAVRIRVLKKALVLIGAENRVPYKAIYQFALNQEKHTVSGIEFSSNNEKVFIKKAEKITTNNGFFAIISNKDSYETVFEQEK